MNGTLIRTLMQVQSLPDDISRQLIEAQKSNGAKADDNHIVFLKLKFLQISKAILCFVAISLYAFNSSAQKSSGLKGIMQDADSIRIEVPTEQLYLHLNKNLYSTIDTIWFKAYLFNPAFLKASEKSGIVYLELTDVNSRTLNLTMLKVRNGIGWGQLSLAELKIPAGSYTLRAYTKWMENFPRLPVYQREIYVYSFAEGYPQGRVSFARLQPNRDDKAGVPNGSHKKIDLHFWPEGGRLVSGIKSKIGFQALDERGSGVLVEGIVVNSQNIEVATFKSDQLGIGSFELLPRRGDKYTAKLSLSKEQLAYYSLPEVQTGIALKVRNAFGSDSIIVEVSSSADMLNRKETFYIIGQSRGVVCFGATMNSGMFPVKNAIAKSAFPTGISKIFVLDSKKQVVNERMLFIDHQDNLRIAVEEGPQTFRTDDSIRFKIKANTSDGRPLIANLSMSVTKESGSEKIARDINGNMLSSILLTSELEDFIEQPERYFRMDSTAWNEREDLLLSHYGIEFKNNQSYSEETIINHSAETGIEIRGRVVNSFNRPVENAPVSLFSDNPFMMLETKSDKEGKFSFAGVEPSITGQYLVRTKNNKGKPGNVSLRMDYSKAPVFDNDFKKAIYLFPFKSAEEPFGKANGNHQEELNTKNDNGFLLREVNINAKKIIASSKNLNGPGNADLILDQKELEIAGRMTLGNLLKEKVQGFRVGVFPPTQNQFKDYTRLAESSYAQYRTYLVSDKEVRLVIDGIDVGSYFENTNSGNQWYEFMKYYMDNLKAEDIAGVEMMYSWEYNNSYRFRHLSSGQLKLDPTLMDWVFIEITTITGKGPFLQKDPSRALYKTLPIIFPETFRRAEYSLIKDRKLDKGKTLFWVPNLMTDQAGRASISFSSGLESGTYTVVIEGADMNGAIGYYRSNFTIK